VEAGGAETPNKDVQVSKLNEYGPRSAAVASDAIEALNNAVKDLRVEFEAKLEVAITEDLKAQFGDLYGTLIAAAVIAQMRR
jgi:hypothetical protein